MNEEELLEGIKTILKTDYRMDRCQLESVSGGYRHDETFVLQDEHQKKFLVKSIRLTRSKETIENILKLTNLFIDHFQYPTAKIILTRDQNYLIEHHQRLNYLQEFISGFEPKNEYLIAHPEYFIRLGFYLSRWRSISRTLSKQIDWKDPKEFSSSWWIDYHDRLYSLNNGNQPNLYETFLYCQKHLEGFDENHFEFGFIHNDFHPNNSLLDADEQLFIIDLIDGQFSFFIADLANSLFHLLSHRTEGIRRAKAFLHGYQQLNSLTTNDRKYLQLFVQLKLTLSIAEDFQGTIDPFIQSCLDLLVLLDEQPNFIQQHLFE